MSAADFLKQTHADNAQEPAIVFGGSRGIGAAIARRLADHRPVGLTYASSPEAASAVVADIEAAGGRAVAIQADSADASAIRTAVEQVVERHGPLRIAVVNAGIYLGAPLDAFPLDQLDRMLSVNIRGVFVAIQEAARHMHDGGRIITIGSNAAVRSGVVGSSVYAMTKAAIATLVRELALDLAPRGITIANIQPGPIDTDFTASHRDMLAERSPLRRLGTPQEIAGLVAYLASDGAGYLTGASITVDGGISA
jgi:3-oxoacyl-[acyl-carrier protein] reductase